MVLLILAPVLIALFGLSIYKFQTKPREIFRLDLVQFVYLFIVAPALFIWSKTFLFYLMQNELEVSLSITEQFIIDTLFSVLFVVIVAALAIHGLTKTFWIRRYHNPEFDVFHLSEYFHLWWSHIVMYGGAMLMMTFVSISSIYFPQAINLSKTTFIGLQGLGILGGVLLFMIIWMSDPGKGNFMRLMKLLFVTFTLVHLLAYYLLSPGFNSNYLAYWLVLGTFVTASVCGAFFEKYERVGKIRKLFLHVGWGEHLVGDIFKKKN